MDKYFDTGLMTIGEDKDTYNTENISKVIGHDIEKLIVINDSPDHISMTSKIGYRWNKTEFPSDIIVMSKFGYRWNKTILHWGEARLIRNASELMIKANDGSKYRITELIKI